MKTSEQSLDQCYEAASQDVEITLVRGAGPAVMRLAGELDMAGCPRLEEAVRRLESDAPSTIVIDLSRLAFLDCSGVRALLSAKERCRRRGRRLCLVRAAPNVQRVFALTGTERALDFSAADGADDGHVDRRR